VSLRWRLAFISSLVTLLSLAALVVGSGLALERSRLRDLDDELSVQAKVVLDEVDSGVGELSADVSDALQTPSGSSVAWVYRAGRLEFGGGIGDAPEPLDEPFLESRAAQKRCSCAGWRVYSLRQRNVVVQIGRPLEPGDRSNQNYWSVALIGALLAALTAGAVIIVAVNRVTEPLERLARRVKSLDSDAPIPALTLNDEVGALARALKGSLEGLKLTRDREARFLADAAHELRTPVTALLTDLEHHTAKLRASAEDQAVLDRAKRLARRLRDLTGNLLTLTQTDRGLEMRELNLFALAAEVTDRLAPLAAAKGLDLGLDGEPVMVRGDSVALERAVENLVGNAIKFTDAGEIRVGIGAQGQLAQLEVTDTGGGVDPNLIERVFEPFERAGETRREGSGLGLAVVKAVMDAHGGSVRLENTADGSGAVVRLSLPRAV
jgi:signal transduction histidine kinase